MTIEQFIERLKTQSLDQYIQYIVDVYVEAAGSFDSNDGSNLRELFRKDPTSAGSINKEDSVNFYNKKLVADFMMLKGLYKDYMHETDSQAKTNTYSVVANEVIKLITPLKKYITLDSASLRGGRQQGVFEHKFVLNMNANDIFKVVRGVYETAVKNNIDFFISYPNTAGMVEGVNDYVTIMCDTQNLESSLKLFELLPVEIKSMCKTPCPFGAIIDGWLGYTSMDNNDISITVGAAIIQGIDAAIREFATVQPDIAQYVQALDAGTDKDQIRVQVLKIMKELNPSMYQSINNHVKTALEGNNIDLENLFISRTVKAKLVGQQNSVEALVEASNISVLPVEESVSDGSTPLVEGVQAPVEQIFDNNEEKGTTLLSADLSLENRDPSTDAVMSVGEIASDIDLGNPTIPETLNDNNVSVPQSLEYPDVAEQVSKTAVETVISEANRTAYLGIGITEEQLNTLVKDATGNDISLYQYLELNDTLNRISPKARVIMSSDVNSTDLNQEVSGAHFILKVVVPYVLDSRLGYMDLDGIIRLYAKEIVKEEPKKGSLLGRFFKKK